VLARIQVLESDGEISPGASGLIQLRLESPVVALPGERFIIRSYSPSRTIAGGRVLDSFAIKHRGREMIEARSRLTSLMTAGRAEQLVLFTDTAGSVGLSRVDVASRTGWPDDILDDAVREAVALGVLVDAEDVYLSRSAFDSLARATTEEVTKHHVSEPLSRGLPRETLRERLFASASPGVFRAVLTYLENSGTLASEKEIVRASSHTLQLSASDEAIKDSLEAAYRDAALESPTFEEALARASGARTSPSHARTIFQLLIESGTLVRVGNDLVFHRDALDRLFGQLSGYASAHEPERLIDIAAFKDLAGVSRKYAIPLLEYLDREHITRRAGDKRVILKGGG
jgi:selenocysteine-specific elongation factor